MNQDEIWAKELKKKRRLEALDLQRDFGFSHANDLAEQNGALRQLREGIQKRNPADIDAAVLRLVELRCKEAKRTIEAQPGKHIETVRKQHIGEVYRDIADLLTVVRILAQTR